MSINNILILLALMIFSSHSSYADQISEEINANIQTMNDSIQVLDNGTEDNEQDARNYPCSKNNTCYLLDSRFTSSSSKSAAVPVKDSQIRILGKGISGRHSKQTLAIACVGENLECNVMRFIYVVSTSEAYYIGPRFTVTNQKALTNALKKLSASVSNQHDRGLLTLFGGLTASFGIIAVFHVFWPFIAIVSAAFMLYETIGSDALAPMFDVYQPIKNATVGDDGAQLINHDGWNWSIKPRKINEKTFGKMIEELQYGFLFNENKELKTIQ